MRAARRNDRSLCRLLARRHGRGQARSESRSPSRRRTTLVRDRRPHSHCNPFGEVKVVRRRRKDQIVRLKQTCGVELRVGVVDHPRRMVNVGARDHAARVQREEAVALDEEVLQRTRGGGPWRARCAIPRAKLGVRGTGPPRSVGDRAISFAAPFHLRMEVGEVEERARRDDSQALRGVEAEEVDAAHAAAAHVRPDVELGEGADSRYGRHESRRDIAHVEGDDTEIMRTLVSIKLERLGHKAAQAVVIDAPMREEEFMPVLSP